MKTKVNYIKVIRNAEPTQVLVAYDAFDFNPAEDVYENKYLFAVEVKTENGIETYNNVHSIYLNGVTSRITIVSPNEYIIDLFGDEVQYDAGENFDVNVETEEDRELARKLGILKEMGL